MKSNHGDEDEDEASHSLLLFVRLSGTEPLLLIVPACDSFTGNGPVPSHVPLRLGPLSLVLSVNKLTSPCPAVPSSMVITRRFTQHKEKINECDLSIDRLIF